MPFLLLLLSWLRVLYLWYREVHPLSVAMDDDGTSPSRHSPPSSPMEVSFLLLLLLLRPHPPRQA